MTRPDPRLALVADCSSCAGLCCEVPQFQASADFAIDKPGRTPCPHLGADFGCTIHAELPQRGFPGCVVYDCFGSGQQVVAVQFAGADHADPGVRAAMFDAFEVVERLHELLWYVADASARALPRGLADEVGGLEATVLASRDAPAGVEVTSLQARTGALLDEVSSHLRRGLGARDLRDADLAGRDLREEDLYAARLRGAVLIGADLRGADLGPADLLGADLRAADLRGADLSETFCLTRFQVRAARTDATTVLPDVLR
ncbi:hypothetical protein GCM10011519_22560 [Marmoricola endophyticus]|uniref:Pentapeptide repeat-containing protein n=1 Tax=Marmoricola endophyticus TaxID=2040280 RepID=A0A917F3Z5_9ACTN|nr:pentapeptide repeat-containing protein [Marmoricola endophyticus]GGF48055.1 hypothetical protein GCM10011519_22560 [Marmoricola endophyticus]